MKCKICEEELEDITFVHTINGGVEVLLSHKEFGTFYACTNRDCKNCGIVIIIPHNPKD